MGSTICLHAHAVRQQIHNTIRTGYFHRKITYHHIKQVSWLMDRRSLPLLASAMASDSPLPKYSIRNAQDSHLIPYSLKQTGSFILCPARLWIRETTSLSHPNEHLMLRS